MSEQEYRQNKKRHCTVKCVKADFKNRLFLWFTYTFKYSYKLISFN